MPTVTKISPTEDNTEGTPPSDDLPAAAAGPSWVRFLFWLGGVLFSGLGLLGVFLPVLPTTPFLIVAVGCFARSSPRLRQAILDHPRLGPPVQTWFEHKAISRRAKRLATIMILITGSITLYFLPSWTTRGIVAATLSFGLIYVNTRNSPPSE